MSKYRDQNFSQRYHVLGDTAEKIFEELAPLGRWERLGWNRPKISMKHMSFFLKHMPDYATSTGHLVEVGGLGRDGVFKLKVDKYEALKEWHRLAGPLVLFIWNSSFREWSLVDWVQTKSLVSKARHRGVEAFENDGNKYFPIEWAWFQSKVPYESA